jgi:DNA polymerase I
MKIVVWDAHTNHDKDMRQDFFDCALAEFLLSGGKTTTQDEALKLYEVATLIELALLQQKKLEEAPELNTILEAIEQPLTHVLLAMEKRGITVNVEKLTSLGNTITVKLSAVEQRIKAELGDINIASPLQLGNALVNKYTIALPKTKTGAYATGEGELSAYADTYPIISQILTFRELTKLFNTYVQPLLGYVDSAGRIHTTYNQMGAATGRLASLNPNLQNIPNNSNSALSVKSCFVPTKGFVFMALDYSQQELRILAHLAQEEHMIQSFAKGEDIHTVTAARIFNSLYTSVTKEQRNIAKTINFGIIYGMGSFGLAKTLGIQVQEAEAFINAFFANFPRIKVFFDDLIQKGEKQGYIETLLGRRKHIVGTMVPATKREMMNFPVQGSAADIVKLAMIGIYKEIEKKDDIYMLLQIHDELLFEVKNDTNIITHYQALIQKIMEHAYPLSIPTKVDIKMGKNWGEMKS